LRVRLVLLVVGEVIAWRRKKNIKKRIKKGNVKFYVRGGGNIIEERTLKRSGR